MRKLGRFILFPIILISSLIGCLDPYEPPTADAQTDFIVIDGYINSTKNEAIVKVSQSIALSDFGAYPKIDNANVVIEDSNGQAISLAKTTSGNYYVSYNFNVGLNYRVKVQTNNRTYISDYISLIQSNPIDSLTWSADDQYFEVYSNTSDPQAGYQYYRYNFDETYEYNSVFGSSWKFDGTAVTYRENDELIHTCWLTQPSQSIIVTSTENIVENKIKDFPITRIPKGERKLWQQYSALVRQYSIDKKTYEYWSQINKISESLGGLFDPIPYKINGNLRSETDSEEVVIGYFSGGSVSEKRIVVRNNQMPVGYSGYDPKDCGETLIEAQKVGSLIGQDVLLTRPEYMGIFIIGFYYSKSSCVDCRLEGGTNVKPDFMF